MAGPDFVALSIRGHGGNGHLNLQMEKNEKGTKETKQNCQVTLCQWFHNFYDR